LSLSADIIWGTDVRELMQKGVRVENGVTLLPLLES